ncbi:MAG: T9SS type A sorting domain-containing protein [Chitinophagales bacterium]
MLFKTPYRVWAVLLVLLAVHVKNARSQTPYLHNEPQLQAAEFFWDADPGYGNGYSFNAIDGNFNEPLEQILRNTAPMPAVGLHLLNIRVKDGKGNWGPLFKKAFQVEDSAKVANGVKLKAAEYFWDTDPGYGSGTALIAFDGNFNEALEQVFKNTTSLPAAGMHLFNIRVRDSENNWGPLFKKAVQLEDIAVTQRLLSVKAAEYFWDTDPGYGSATALLAFDGNFNEALENVFTNNATLPAVGMHLFNVRVKSEHNTWGPLFKKAVQITDVINNPRLLTVKAAEYFWDTDPGYGSATTLLAFDGNFNEALESIVTNNATLPATGMHLFNVRVRSENNNWGPLFKKAVQITDVVNNPRLLTVTAAECFWGTTDPGYGNGITLLAFDGNFNEAIEALGKTLTSFTEGMQLFNLRARDEKNNWGPLFKKAVQADVQPRQFIITQGEYFWDADPGYGNGYQYLAIDGNFNEALENAIDYNGTSTYNGLHLFNTRVKDEKGRWGPLFKKAVMIIADFTELNVTINYDTATICTGDSVYLIASGAGSYVWSPATGLSNTIGAAVFAKPSTTTTYMVIGEGDPGEYDTAYVTVKVVASSIALNLGNDTSICSPATVTLIAGAATTYAWSTGAATQTISVNSTGNYSVTITNAAGCTKADTIHITVDTITNAGMLPLTVTICNGQSASLSATGGNTYLWSNSLGTGPNVTVSPSTTTIYSVTITKGACVTTATRTVTVNQPNTGSITASICQGQSYFFNGVNRTTTGTFLDTLVNTAGCDSVLTLNLTVKPTTSGSINASICQGQSYFFNGANRTTQGAYLDTLVGSNGCDSILTLNLTVKPKTTGSINASICQGQSYFFNGVNRTTQGAYLDTLVGSNGCDSILTLNLTVKPKTTGSINASICQGQSYFFNGANRTTQGAYLDTLVGSNGCDSILTLNLTVKSTTSGSINASICQGQSYFFNGANRTTQGAYLDTLVGSIGCDSILTLNLTVKPTTSGSINASICQGQSYLFNGVNRTTQGTYLDTLVGSNGCDSILTLNLTVKPKTTGSINASICQGQSYLFNGVSRTTSGTYLDTLVNVAGCDSFLTLNLTVSTAVTSSFSVGICQGQSYLWNGINRTTTGAYLDTLSANGGCDSIVTLNLTVNQPTSGSINASICPGQSYFFNGANRTTQGAYLDTLVGSNGCDSVVILNLTVHPVEQTILNASICNGQSYLFSSQTLTQAGVYYDTLQTMNGCDSIVTLNLTVNLAASTLLLDTICSGDTYDFNGDIVTQQGIYADTLQTVNGCDSIVTLTLTLHSLPVSTITKTVDTLYTQSFAAYQWLKNDTAITGADSASLVLLQPGNYSVLVTDSNGCSDTSSVINVLSVDLNESLTALGVKLYPNPNTGNFVVEFNSALPREINVTDAIGRLIYTTQSLLQTVQLDLDEVAAGVYFLNIRQQKQTTSLKFSVIR